MGVNREFAGTACHQESAYLQEIASEVAMRDRQHVWVDGSLSDGQWYSQVSNRRRAGVRTAERERGALDVYVLWGGYIR